MTPQHPQDLPETSQNIETDAFLGEEFSPLDAVLNELTRLDRELITMKSRVDVFAKTIDRHAAQMDALRSYVAQSDIFMSSLLAQKPPPPPRP